MQAAAAAQATTRALELQTAAEQHSASGNLAQALDAIRQANRCVPGALFPTWQTVYCASSGLATSLQRGAQLGQSSFPRVAAVSLCQAAG